MHFTRALGRYHDAVASDSAFALAALKGAQSANWLALNDQADSLADVALRHPGSLSPRYQQFGQGLKSYLHGSADSAINSFRRVLEVDSTWSEAWMALGEVYYHLLPARPGQDSVAEVAFQAAQHADSEFTPPLFHLAEIALRRHDIPRAEALVQRFQKAEPDASLVKRIALMLKCVRDGPGAVDWIGAVRSDAADVLKAARLLSVGARQAACAGSGFSAVFYSDSAAVNLRWGALLGLQGLLVASGNLAQLRALLDSKAAEGLAGQTLYLPIAATGVPLESRADSAAENLGRDYSSMSPPVLWALGLWAAHRGQTAALTGIAKAVRHKADSSQSRRDKLIARVIDAHLTLALKDTAKAVEELATLTPSGAPQDLEWQPWESLGSERLSLASLYLSRREFGRAYDVAALLEAPEPIFYLTYLRASLLLRATAADSLGKSELADEIRRRTSTLSTLDVSGLIHSP